MHTEKEKQNWSEVIARLYPARKTTKVEGTPSSKLIQSESVILSIYLSRQRIEISILILYRKSVRIWLG